MKICLIVEDDPDWAKKYIGLATRQGYSPEVVGNREEALFFAKRFGFDFCISDGDFPLNQFEGVYASQFLDLHDGLSEQQRKNFVLVSFSQGNVDLAKKKGIEGFLKDDFTIGKLAERMSLARVS